MSSGPLRDHGRARPVVFCHCGDCPKAQGGASRAPWFAITDQLPQHAEDEPAR
ncbi:hypothetical protein [Sandaracinus amylolyticus]|uniref:CENP-V/GFA domain-containing protein n=1 Tax=Sandaracinus amylolyticus TaxID=927083 RepID=A0A0F6VYM6_9BACT|nr:hypothetical protein [Sandaracinus amylolyticus]AKF02936.1 hypothetical protein DB32_000084 [Sandaracinus amylolyticus]